MEVPLVCLFLRGEIGQAITTAMLQNYLELSTLVCSQGHRS